MRDVENLWPKSTGVGSAGAMAVVLVAALLAVLASGCSQATSTPPPPSPTAQPTRSVPVPTLVPKLSQRSGFPPFVDVELLSGGDKAGNTQYPAYLLAEMSGRQLNNVSLIGGSVQENGRQRILLYQAIDADPEDGIWPGTWEDGVYDLSQTWDFTGDYLWDGQQGDFVILWTTDPSAGTRTVHGRYRASGTESYVNAVLVVDLHKGMAQDVIVTETGEARSLLAGDEFQPDELILDETGELHSEPGVSLSFEEGGHLAYARRPVASGLYFLGMSAEAEGGAADAVYARFEVDNEGLLAGYKAFLNPEEGFQLLYPETWPVPTKQTSRLLFSDEDGLTQMSVSSHPDMSDRPLTDLKQRVLDAYGQVTVLYEDQVQVGQSGGLRTVYGYQAPDRQRTGIMMAFAEDGLAYVIDIDGPASDEAALLNLANVVASSWTSRSVLPAGTGRWAEVMVDGLPVRVPANHRPHQMDNGWQRFAGDDELTFLAMRSEAAADRGLFVALEHWLGIAGGSVRDFTASDIYTHERAGRSWARFDIEYALDSGEQVGGAIMMTRIGDRFLVLWAETSLDAFAAYEENVLSVVVDALSRARYDRGQSDAMP